MLRIAKTERVLWAALTNFSLTEKLMSIRIHDHCRGAKFEHLPSALLPARTALIGRYVTLEPLDAAQHASDLFEASHGSKAALRIWDYLPWGPWKSEAEFANVLRQQTAGRDRIYYTIRLAAGEKACGQICFLDIQPEQGVIEIGSIWFGLTLRRTRSATESIYLDR